jgi:DNA-binding PadR family transcriptional regulator
MSVRMALLAILDQGDCYGYQLRTEYERRSARSVNVGQVYNTLDRLERDKLVRAGAAGDDGHRYYAISDTGRQAVREWFAASASGESFDELTLKVVLAAGLPGVDAASVVAHHSEGRRVDREAIAVRAKALTAPDAFALRLSLEADGALRDAEISWLDGAASFIADTPPDERQSTVSRDLPRRGRPSTAPVGVEPAGT